MGYKQPKRDVGPPLMLTYAEAADYTGIGLSKLYRLMREGEIRKLEVGPRDRRIPRSECDAYVAKLMAEQLGESAGAEADAKAGAA